MLMTVDTQLLNPEAAKAAPAYPCRESLVDRRPSGEFLALAGRYAR
jgi:hypothetical protein